MDLSSIRKATKRSKTAHSLGVSTGAAASSRAYFRAPQPLAPCLPTTPVVSTKCGDATGTRATTGVRRGCQAVTEQGHIFPAMASNVPPTPARIARGIPGAAPRTDGGSTLANIRSRRPLAAPLRRSPPLPHAAAGGFDPPFRGRGAWRAVSCAA